MAARGVKGVARVLDKLEASINSGQYYEAHQMYRTLYFRYLNQKKYDILLSLLYKGSTLLLEHDQQGSGADLAILFIEVLNRAEIKPNEEWIENIAKLFEIMNPNIPEREAFLTNSIKWTMDINKKGHPLLHKKVAEVYWKEKKYTAAHKHFLHSCDGATYAAMLIELHTTKGMKSEVDLFITQAVLQFLCLRNKKMANETFNKYTGSHPTIKNKTGPPYLFPLLNFLWFLLRAIEHKHTKQFKTLRAWYAISIKRDPNYNIYLDNIGRIWFGIELPQDNKSTGGLFGGLIKTIMGEGDSSDEDEYVDARPAALDLD